jgi:hypothetical protein
MFKKVPSLAIAGGMALVGLVVGIATIAGAQSAVTKVAPVTNTVGNTVTTQTVDTPESGDTPDSVVTSSIDTPELGDVADGKDTEATSSIRQHGEGADKVNDSDGSAVKEASESATSSDTTE